MWRNAARKYQRCAGVATSVGNISLHHHRVPSTHNVNVKIDRSSFSSLSTRSRGALLNNSEQRPQAGSYPQHPANCTCCCQLTRCTCACHTKSTSTLLHPAQRHFSSNVHDHNKDNDKDETKQSAAASNDSSMKVASEDPPAPTTDFSIPGAQKGGKKLAIVFTCTVCDTRAAKQFTENAYQNGVVVVTCPGCGNKHLIADNLGYFKEDEDAGGGWNIETAMAKLGQNVNMVTNDNVMELSLEDIYGEEAIQNALGSHGEEERSSEKAPGGS
jgi:hypothetical protein